MAPEFGKSIHHLPLIPADVRNKYHVHEPLETRFPSAAIQPTCLRILIKASHLGEAECWCGLILRRFGKFACPLERANRPGPHGICEPPLKRYAM
jgi:hypothetical protein